MKKLRLLLAAFAAVSSLGAYAQTDAEREAALEAVADGNYGLVAEFNSKTYVVTAAGRLTDDPVDAATFAVSQDAAEGQFAPVGFRMDTGRRFTNGGNASNVITSLNNLAVSTQDRSGFERQVLYLNEDGYYAVRGTNATSTSWGASAFWTVVEDNDGDDLPNATYSMDEVNYYFKLVPEAELEALHNDVALERQARIIAKLQALVDDASYANGKEALQAAIDDIAAAGTVEEIHTQTLDAVLAELLDAFTWANASEEHPYDASARFITNPTPVNNLDGWTGTGIGGHDNGVAEYWNKAAASFQQTVSLPAGVYSLSLVALTRTGMVATLEVAGKSVNIATVDSGTANGRDTAADWFNAGNGVNTIDFQLNDAAEVTIKVTADNTTGDHWMVWRNFTLLYKGVPADPLKFYKEQLAEAAEGINGVTGLSEAGLAKVQADVDALNVEYATQEEYEAATEAVKARVADAKAAATIIASYPALKAKVLALADQDVYTGDATIETAAADAAIVDAASTAEANAAVAALRKAGADFLGAVTVNEGARFDITDAFLVNADFEAGNISGWETNYVPGQQAVNIGYQRSSYINDADPDNVVTISKFIEAWKPQPGTLGDGYLRQTASNLPAGTYQLEADVMATFQGDANREVEGMLLYIESNGSLYTTSLATANEKPEHFSVNFVSPGDVDVIFGLQSKNANANWLGADNFKVYYYGSVIDLTPIKAQLAAICDEAAAIAEGTVPAATYEELSQVTVESYEDMLNEYELNNLEGWSYAVEAARGVVDAAKALVAPYATFKALKAGAEALAAADHVDLVEGANAALANVISQNDVDTYAYVDAEELDNAITKITEAAWTYVKNADPANEARFSLTFLLTNPSLDAFPGWTPRADVPGWYSDQPDGNSQTMVNDGATSADGTKTHFFEYWSEAAKANGEFALYQKVTLPAGTYDFECYAFASANGIAGATQSAVYFYANDTKGGLVNTERLSQASISFVNDAEQEVKVGLKTMAGNQFRWMGIGYVELYKVAAKVIELDENVAYVPESTAGTVTLVKNIAEGWNTIVLPFGVDAETVEAQFGEGQLYKFDDADLGVVNFTEVTAIEPGVPYIFNAAAANTEVKTFEGVTIATTTPVAAGSDYNFVGTYAPTTVEAGNYVLGNGNFVLTAGGNALKGFRAYLQANEDVPAVKALTISLNGVATAVESIDGERIVSGEIYNIAGQRVARAQKGLYIVGGRKVLR